MDRKTPKTTHNIRNAFETGTANERRALEKSQNAKTKSFEQSTRFTAVLEMLEHGDCIHKTILKMLSWKAENCKTMQSLRCMDGRPHQ
ncbi:hypothetical protein KIN20_033730 [Parelaphostrongylus tenuis]|uniref:Uncharacterized protein n=1 Tax=Parelaphostrongylus tenuis TaxID=148309 RepID=A0AAD5R948_PARTN|nr:hypothetical protein KIN20_033730 [Parelaphostrongylus tenuis]